MENKKTLVLSILGVLVLVVAVVGVSFAMYSFSATGTKENVIQTGTVSVSYTETTTLALTNQYPMSDALGTEQSETLSFTVSTTMSGTMTINYDLALTEVTEGATLKASNVKFNMTKDGNYLYGTENTGVLVSTRAANNGTIITTGGYLLDTDTFTATGQSHTYVIKAWVDSNYNLPNQDIVVEGTTQSNQTTSETFSFKVKVVAQQA